MDETINNVPRRPSPVLTRQFSVINSSKLPDLLLKSNPPLSSSSSSTAETPTCPDDDNSHRVSWKTFKDRLLIRRATSAFSETLTLDPPTPNGATATLGEPIRVSLMALLEQTDMMGGTGTPEKKPTVLISSEEGEEEEEGEEMAHECCVCMVRHNGAPFVPCGHTFCRLCSRELWVVRGNYCPLCNGYVLEILDVF